MNLKDESPARICKSCEKIAKMCSDFKRKCIEADLRRKIESQERFIWTENLRELRKLQPVEDEVTTIETMGTFDQFNADEKCQNPPAELNSENYDFIDNLSFKQLEELTNELSTLLENMESEQFQFVSNNVSKATHCRKCKLKFPDAKKLRVHIWNDHVRRRKGRNERTLPSSHRSRSGLSTPKLQRRHGA